MMLLAAHCFHAIYIFFANPATLHISFITLQCFFIVLIYQSKKRNTRIMMKLTFVALLLSTYSSPAIGRLSAISGSGGGITPTSEILETTGLTSSTTSSSKLQEPGQQSTRKISWEGDFSSSSSSGNRHLLQVPTNFQGLDENFLRLSIQAGEVSKACNDDEYSNRLFPRAARWINEPDGAMVCKVDDICFAAFRATTWTFDDWSQNLDPGFSGAVCNLLGLGNRCCNTRRGYRDAFVDVDYFDEFEVSLQECVQSCPDGDCEVVLTGTSQGGAVAQVAAVMLSEYNPTTITFGQPPTMEGSCHGMDNDKLYRWVNTLVVKDELKYDPVPFLVEFGGVDHSGHMFVLGEDDANVAHYRNNDAPAVGPNNWTYRHILGAHNIDRHIERIQAFLDSGNVPVNLNGFANGVKCTQDHECSSSICVGYCSDGQIGDKCKDNNDCNSRICGRTEFCTAGNVGDPCWRENQCSSRNTCEGIVNAVCEAKRSRGRGCNENDDCLSGNCSWFTCR